MIKVEMYQGDKIDTSHYMGEFEIRGTAALPRVGEVVKVSSDDNPSKEVNLRVNDIRHNFVQDQDHKIQIFVTKII